MKNKVMVMMTCLLFLSFYSDSQENDNKLFLSNDAVYLNNVIKRNKIAVDSNNSALRNMGIAYHQLAILKNEDASSRAVEYLDKYLEKSPDDKLAQAFLGSAYTMLARDTSGKLKQLYYVNKSLSLLDDAVTNEPNNYIIRLIRANVTYAIPTLFNRRETAQTDFEYLVKHFKLNNNLLSMIYYRLGKLSEKNNQMDTAKNYFKSSISISPKSKWADRARLALAIKH